VLVAHPLDPETRPTEAACAILKDRMKIAVAADHAGFPLKDRVIEEVRKLGHQVFDLGTHSTDPVDYPDYARAVAEALREGRAERAVLICGSGAGACVAANKFRGIRAATCHDTFSAHQGVEDDGMNVLCLGARVIGPELATELLRSYLSARFSDLERHRRRVSKVEQFEEEFGASTRLTR
jgi:ribose 5-phosphate isomerase B